MNKEIETKKKDLWYERLIEINSNPNLYQRYAQLVQLHQETLAFYLATLKQITEEKAWKEGTDGRPLALVVAHIMAWEEYQIQVFTDQDRNSRLLQQTQLQKYYDSETGKFINFKSVDEFNAYQAQKYSNSHWSWKEIKYRAIGSAMQLKGFFPANPPEGWIEFLENTPIKNWQIFPERKIETKTGWYLWIVSLEHEAITHRQDLV